MTISLHNRIFASSITSDPSEEKVEVDVGGIFRRLLLFDTYILNSVRLKEIPEMVNRIGYDQTLQLLKSKALRIHCDALSTGQTGQLSILKSREQKGILPKGSYCFQSVSILDRRDYISGCFKEAIAPMSLSIKQKKMLKHAILESLETPPKNIGNETINQLKTDLRQGNPALITSIVKELKEQFEIKIDSSQISVRLYPIDDNDFYSESNLMEKVGLDLDQNHKVIERAALNLAGVNQRLAEMKEFSAISGFRVNDLPIFEKKIEYFMDTFDPDKHENRIQRVCEITDLPDFRNIGIDYKIDIDQFFKIRESSECCEFREWLRSIDSKSDKEIKNQISSLRSRITKHVNTSTGRTLRFITSNVLGFIPGAGIVLGPIASGIDTFLIDKVFSTSGILIFIGKMYPSLFNEIKS